jgi:hypothetical protein
MLCPRKPLLFNGLHYRIPSALLLCLMLAPLAYSATPASWFPFDRPAWTTSSFGENRGGRYHAGFDFSTNKEQGWPVHAPETGRVERLLSGPYFYGKALYFRGASGNLYLFAHLSGWPAPMDSLVLAKRFAQKSNQVELEWAPGKGPEFPAGAIVAFSGMTGIGDPHLHVEVRPRDGVVANPVEQGLALYDTLAPQFLELALQSPRSLRTYRLADSTGRDLGAEVSSGAPNARSRAPLEVYPDDQLLVKAVDYSRTPRENPMSLASLEVRCGGKSIWSKKYRSFRLGAMGQIREDLAWAREGSEAGDWHLLAPWRTSRENLKVAKDARGPLPWSCLETERNAHSRSSGLLNGTPQAPADTATLELEARDFHGLNTLVRIPLRRAALKSFAAPSATGPAVPALRAPASLGAPRQDNQDSTLFTFLGDAVGEPMVASAVKRGRLSDLLSSQIQAVALDSAADSLRWSAPDSAFSLSLQKAPSLLPRLLTLEWTADPEASGDSARPFSRMELHPKGLMLQGDLEACLQAKKGKGWALFWRSEGSRSWNLFGKQERKGSGITSRLCARLDELRDLAVLRDTVAPRLDSLRLDTLWWNGQAKVVPTWSLLPDLADVSHANLFTAIVDGHWTPVEYNSTRRWIQFPELAPNAMNAAGTGGASGSGENSDAGTGWRELKLSVQDDLGNRSEWRTGQLARQGK